MTYSHAVSKCLSDLARRGERRRRKNKLSVAAERRVINYCSGIEWNSRQRIRIADNSWQDTAMGNEGDIPKDKRKSNMLLSAVLGVAGLALGWAALEIGMGSIQKPGRENIDRSREPKVYEVVGEEPGVIFVQERSQNDENQDKEAESDTQREEDIEALDNRTRRILRDEYYRS